MGRRGSAHAYLGWLGIVVYSVYSYAIYALDVRFNALFLVYVAVLGLSIYALIGGLTAMDPVPVKTAFSERAPVRKTPQGLIDAGLSTSPVHVLDMAVLLPPTLVTGALLSKGVPGVSASRLCC